MTDNTLLPLPPPETSKWAKDTLPDITFKELTQEGSEALKKFTEEEEKDVQVPFMHGIQAMWDHLD